MSSKLSALATIAAPGRTAKFYVYDPSDASPTNRSKAMVATDVRGLMDIQVATIAALNALSVTGLPDGTLISVAGYYAAGDGGGGLFRYSSGSAATVNIGTIFAPTVGVGRWLRVYSGPVLVDWFGAVADGVTNDAAAFNAAILWQALLGNGVVISPRATYKLSSTVIVPSGIFLDLCHTKIVGPGIGNATDVIQSGYVSAGAILTNVGGPDDTNYVKETRISHATFTNCGKALNLLNLIDNCEVSDLKFVDCTYAVKARRSWYCRFVNLFSRGTAAASGNAAMYFDGAVNVEQLESVFVTDRTLGVEVNGGANGLKFLNCSVEQGTDGVKVNGDTGPIEFDTCYFEALTGIAVNCNTAGGVKNNVTFNNNFFNTIGTAIKSELTTGATLFVRANNRFIACTNKVTANDNYLNYGKIEIPTVAYADNGTPVVPAAYSLGAKSEIEHVALIQDSVSGLTLVKSQVHGNSPIPFCHEGAAGTPKSGTVSFCTKSFVATGGTTFSMLVDTPIVWGQFSGMLVYRFEITDNLGTYQLFGLVLGDTVKQLDATAKNVVASNNGGFVRLTVSVLDHPAGMAGCTGIVRHL